MEWAGFTDANPWDRDAQRQFLYIWRCNDCKAVVKATESCGMPGRLVLVCAGLPAGLTCEQSAALRDVHLS
jgi:hypothetical protein